MRIDFVTTELFVGGAEKCLTEVAIACARAGDDVRVMSLGSLPTGERGLLVERLNEAGVASESLQADSIWRYPAAQQELKNWLRDDPPELVQTFLHHANVLGMHAASRSLIKARVGGIRVAQPRPLRSRIERLALKRATSVICVSQAVGRFAADQLGCDRDSIVVIPNGVDVDRFQSAAPFDWSGLGWAEESLVSLFIGRLHSQKGIELLQQEIDQLAPAGSNRRLLMVGDGPLKTGLEAWCRQVGTDRVQLLPWQADIAPLMRACAIFVLPSHYEGMPNVILEAMAAGKPVISSLVEGSEELLAHAPSQQGFRAGDARAMALLAQQMLDDEVMRAEVGRNNLMRVRNDFSIASMCDAYRQHYLSLLESGFENQ